MGGREGARGMQYIAIAAGPHRTREHRTAC
jgi:hypothetical protein